MRKSTQIFLYFFVLSIIGYGKENIIIYYGNKVLSEQSKYDMSETITNKIVITPTELEFLDFGIKKEITESEYKKISELILKIVKSKKKSICYGINNKNNSLITRVPSKTVNKMNMILEYNNKNYCITGKNELLEYLNNKYSLNIKWEDDPLGMEKILTSEKIELAYGRKEVLNPNFSYHRREEIETKIVVYKDKIEIISLDQADIKIKELSGDEYNKVVYLIEKTLKEEKFVICDGIINVTSVIHSEVDNLKPIITIIYLNNNEYCMIGKTSILEYLDKKYDLKIEWQEIIGE